MNFSWEFQHFDTEILGFKTAKILSLGEDNLQKSLLFLIEDLKKNNITYATFRLPSGNFSVIHALEKSGFLLIDGIVSLECSFQKSTLPKTHLHIREANGKDKGELESLAGKVFSLNRFFNDPYIPKEKAHKIYTMWMRNSLLGSAADAVLVYEEIELLGFITIQKDGHIPLIGVDQKNRGKGIAKHLTMAALSVLQTWGAPHAAIETQIANIPAIRAYEACGFKITNSFLTFSLTL